MEHFINFTRPTANGEIRFWRMLRLFFGPNLLDPGTNSMEYIKILFGKTKSTFLAGRDHILSLTFVYIKPRTVPHKEYPVSVEIQKENAEAVSNKFMNTME